MGSVFYEKEKIAENEYSFAVYDKYPVTEGHTLVVPKQEIADLFELSQEEYLACFKLVKQVRKILIDVYQPQGFNIGVNNSPVAGQTIPHVHIHIILHILLLNSYNFLQDPHTQTTHINTYNGSHGCML